MRTPILAASALAVYLSLAACMSDGYNERPGYNDRQEARAERREDRREWRLSRRDRVYRDRDGRYHCQRDDGTTGLLIGAVAGGVLGNILAPDRSETVGTLIGAAGGAAIGQAIDRGELRCE